MVQAIVVERAGGPEVLELQERPTPELGPGQVRVDVAAAGVNFIDIYKRSGTYPMTFPFVAGSEGAGRVSAVGEGVGDVAEGDLVAWAMVDGAGYASQVVVPADRVVPVPDGVEPETAAAAMLQGMTAHYLVESTYPVKAGDDVLVHAAAGGMGLLLTQIATAKGARVIGTTSTPEKAELARAAGAAEVILYGRGEDGSEVDVAASVREITGGKGVAVVYDGVGRSTFAASLDSLARRGMLALYGGASGPVEPVDPMTLNAKGSVFLTRPTLAHHVESREDLLARSADVFGWITSGTVDFRIGARYPLAQARRAHEDLEGRRTTGKLLLVPDVG